MAKSDRTKTAEKPKAAAEKVAGQAAPASDQAVAATEPEGPRGMRLRIPYIHRAQELYGIDPLTWNVLISAVWPAARTPEAIMLALAYCKGRHLDPMKKMVHIVPVWDKNAPGELEGTKGGFVETVWPSIAEIRVTATRTGAYAGKDAMVFGPLKKRTFKGERTKWENRQKTVEKYEVELEYPEWAELTVYKIVQGIRCAFVGPKVVWEEAYATESRWSEAPNEMWADRKQGQLDKCAEAAALRSAFPEELGGEYAAEEMWGKTVDFAPPARQMLAHQVQPKPNLESEFKRAAPSSTAVDPTPKAEPAKKDVPAARKEATKKPAAANNGGDPRGDVPPLDGEVAGAEEEGPRVERVDPAEERQKIETLLHDATPKLDACTKVGQVADLREEVEQEIPPAFEDLLKEWNAACDAKQKAIIDARPKK